MLENNLLPF